MNKPRFAPQLFGSLALMLLLSAPSWVAAQDKKEDQKRDEIRTMARNTLERLYQTQPAAKGAIGKAAGYAVFSNFGMKIFVAGGGKGQGVAVDKAGKEVFMKAVEVQAGLGMGIKKFRLIWVFETRAALDRFIQQGWQLGGQAGYTAKASGKGSGLAGAAAVEPGVWLYQLTDDGLAAEITVKGSRYYKDDELN
jgi:lipid-binding SYLF domain-containing protein